MTNQSSLFTCREARLPARLHQSGGKDKVGQGEEGEAIRKNKKYMSNNHTPISRARKLRKEMTEEEKILWQNLRGRRFLGFKFLRQHPIVYDIINDQPKYFIPDFYCAEKKLIIEIDGKIHEFQKSRDNYREEILTNAGYQILRFKNDDINKSLISVLKRIEDFMIKINSP